LLAVELGFLADRVASRLRTRDLAGRTVTVRVRFPRMRSVTRSTTLPEPISTTRALADVSVELAQTALADNDGEREITLVAISVSGLVSASAVQMALPLARPDAPVRPTAPSDLRIALDHAVDEVRAKFGRAALGHAAVVFREGGGAPDEFRELAQADPPVAPAPAGRYGRSPHGQHGEGER
jgi:DNA polymerase-4